MRRPLIRRNLAELGADLSRDLRVHQLLRNQRDRFADEVLNTPVAHPRHNISNRRHALTFDHRGVSFSNDSWWSRRG
jgi:hypothetical protein